VELEKVKDDLSKMVGELMKKILSCRVVINQLSWRKNW